MCVRQQCFINMAIAVLKDFADYPTLGRRIIGRTHQSYWGRKSEYTENNKPSLITDKLYQIISPKIFKLYRGGKFYW